MESRLDTALRLNNEGVSLLLQNKDSAAVHRLTEALSMVKQALCVQQQSGTGTGLEESSESLLPSDLLVHESIYTIPGLASNDCFIYNGAIIFSNTTLMMRSEEQDLNVYIACIILNIAMIYHRQGVLSGNKKACLDKADLMYDMVSSLLTENSGGTALLVQLASLNNRSLIRLEQGDYDYSRSAFYHLTMILNGTQEDQVQQLFGAGDAANVNISHHQGSGEAAVQGMLLNAILANTPTTAAAA